MNLENVINPDKLVACNTNDSIILTPLRHKFFSVITRERKNYGKP